MKLLFSFFVFFPIWLIGQTNISGIINTYSAVVSYQEEDCGGTITVVDASGIEPNSLAIIIQMKGATINEGNNASFGSITDMGSAGYYELIHITTVVGNEISLAQGLLQTYNYSFSVQLVSLPNYEAVNVVGEVTGMPWNGSIGGVIAMKAANVNLQSGINASGLGFRGGVAGITASNNCSAFTNANDYWYDPSDWRGARKGEGIVASISGKESGRGALGNGGGGANDHNAGGGGGANTSSGGNGGKNKEPSFFGCDGDFPGIGGKAISQEDGRLFLGGGGGAGHENNNIGSDGGHGGGIVIIITDEYVGNTQTIQANGRNALSTIGSDGAGGGGASGTIVVIANTFSGLNLQAIGGNGGDADNNGAERCTGPGGGGSGGRILTSFAVTPSDYSLTGGIAGNSINSSDCPVSSNEATGGTAGDLGAIISILENEIVLTAPSFLDDMLSFETCEGQSVVFSPEFEGEGLGFQWEIDTGSGFNPLLDDLIYQGVTTATLIISEPSIEMETYEYRLILLSECFDAVESDGISITVAPLANALFDTVIDGLEVTIQNASEYADSYFWDFGDGNTSTVPTPIYSYESGGEYVISLTVTNDCGVHTFTQTIEIGIAPVAQYSNAHSGGCAPLQVDFFNESIGDYTSIYWSFPGGMPATSTGEHPVVTYNEPGVYGVTLTIQGGLGESSVMEEEAVTIVSVPSALFTYEMLSPNVFSFENTSENANHYNWNFGDGTTSTEEHPTHEYLLPGIFQVTLNAQNNFCGSTYSETVVFITEIKEANSDQVIIFPNPVKDILNISAKEKIINIKIYDARAAFIKEQTINNNKAIDLSFLSTGVYFLILESEYSQFVFKLLKVD